MGIFSTISQTIEAVAQPIIRAANATDKSLAAATTYVDVNADKASREIKRNANMAEAKNALAFRRELDEDEELKAIFEEIRDEFYA